MIKAHSIKCNARSRRDERRKAKQQAFAAANPMLAGRKYENVGETITPVQRPGYAPKPLRAIASSAKKEVAGYKNQIIRATYLYMHEFKRKPIDSGAQCLPDVALYQAGHRSKPVNPYHVVK